MPLPSLPNPRTWSQLDLVTAPRLRADVSNAVSFLAQRPSFIGQNNTGALWGTGADNGLGLPVELADLWSMHATSGQVAGATSAQIFAPVPGWYLGRAVITCAYTGGTPQQFNAGFSWSVGGSVRTAVRGPAYLDNTGSGIIAQSTDLLEQTATGPVGGFGDYILATLYASGGTVNLGVTNPPTVTTRWICSVSGTAPLPVPPLTAPPVPPVYTTSAWLNANIRDTIRYLIYPPFAKGIYTAGTNTMPSNTLTSPSVVPVNTQFADNYNAFNPSTFTYTAPVAGRYFVYGQFNLATNLGSYAVGAGIRVNGGTTAWGDIAQISTAGVALNVGASVTRRIRLNAGDTVQLMGTQGSGSAIAYATDPANQTRFIVVWEGV